MFRYSILNTHLDLHQSFRQKFSQIHDLYPFVQSDLLIHERVFLIYRPISASICAATERPRPSRL